MASQAMRAARSLDLKIAAAAMGDKAICAAAKSWGDEARGGSMCHHATTRCPSARVTSCSSGKIPNSRSTRDTK